MVRKLQSAALQQQLLQIGRPLIGLPLCAGFSILLEQDTIRPIFLIKSRISLTRLALIECNRARYRAIFAPVQQPLYLTQSVTLRGPKTFKYRGRTSNEALLKDSVIGDAIRYINNQDRRQIRFSIYLLNLISYIYRFSILTINLKSLLKKYALLFIIVFYFLFLGGI